MRMSLRPMVQTVQKSPKIVKILLIQQFLEGFVPIMALYAIMFSRVGHLNFGQIGVLFSIWSLAYLVAELPSGILADFWSRRNVILVGGGLRGAGFIIWMLWPSFTGFAVGFALWGVMIACSSGAVAAYLHHELQGNQSAHYAKYFGWVMAAYSLGSLLGYVVAAALTLHHANLLIALSAVSSIVFAVILGFAPERPYTHQATYLKTLRAGLKVVADSKKLRYVSFALFSVYMIIGVVEELLPRAYAHLGLNDTWVSVFGALALLATVLLLTRLESIVRFSLFKQMLVMGAGIVLLLAGLYWGALGASVLILLFNLIFHLFRPIFMHHVQDMAEGNERATINSIPGLAAGLLSAGAYFVIGKVAERSSETFSIGLYGFVWLLVFVALAYTGRKYKIPPKAHRLQPEVSVGP